MSRRSASPWFALAVPLALALGACAEDLETGATCPSLCPGQQLVVRDTLLEPAYVFDTSLTGFPTIGLESPLLLAARGDTLDLRAVVRFDTVTRYYRETFQDTLRPITQVDSGWLLLRLQTNGLPLPSEYYVDVYDVHEPGLDDTVSAAVLPYFVPERLLGTYVGTSDLADSVQVRIPLDTAKLRAIVTDTTRPLRVGLQVRSPESVQLSMRAFDVNGGGGPQLEFWVFPDSQLGRLGPMDPYSLTPERPPAVTDDLADYGVVVTAPTLTATGKFVIGGAPGARTYIRFDLPRWVTDSVGLLRAQLELTQDPNYSLPSPDSVTINTHLVLAGASIDDPRRAATLLSAPDVFTTALRLLPTDSGLVVLELNRVMRQWNSTGALGQIPSAILLRNANETGTPHGIRFFGISAADPTLRPRLRISYTPDQVFGRP